jgi:hypothetical protein
MAPSTSRAPATAHFLTTPSTSRASSISMTPPPAPRASEMTPPAPRVAGKPSSSSTTLIGRTSDIKCHRCHGVGHFQRDCPSKKSYIATDTHAIHYGRSNKYTIVHNRKKMTLLPLTPNEIVQCDRAMAETAR